MFFTKKYKIEIEDLKQELLEANKQKDTVIDESSKLALTIVKLRSEIKELKAQLKESIDKKTGKTPKVTKTPKKTSKKTDRV